MIDHILRVGLLPVVSVAALQAGFLLGGTVITEMIFVQRRLGQVLLTAVTNRDIRWCRAWWCWRRWSTRRSTRALTP